MNKTILLLLLHLGFSPAFAAKLGESLPECMARELNNNEILDLQKNRNKVLLIDFWATWCPPCKKSMPFLNKLRNEFFDKGFEVIAINVDETTEDARKFLQKYPVDYVIAYDPKGECPAKYEVKAMPSSFIIDKNGKIRHIHLGFRSSDKKIMTDQVLELLQEED